MTGNQLPNGNQHFRAKLEKRKLVISTYSLNKSTTCSTVFLRYISTDVVNYVRVQLHFWGRWWYRIELRRRWRGHHPNRTTHSHWRRGHWRTGRQHHGRRGWRHSTATNGWRWRPTLLRWPAGWASSATTFGLKCELEKKLLGIFVPHRPKFVVVEAVHLTRRHLKIKQNSLNSNI